MDEKTLRRFWSKIDKNGPIPAHRPELGRCWVWTFSTRSGYGAFRIGNRMHGANRVAWLIQHGPIPKGLCALHQCDNKPCVRGTHLFLGTKTENNTDRDAKNRQARGETNARAKLTKNKVIDIRSRYASGGTSHRKLAKEFNISRGYVSKIVNRKNWTHIGASDTRFDLHRRVW